MRQGEMFDLAPTERGELLGQFIIPGKPVAAPRPRGQAKRGPDGRWFAHIHMPDSYIRWMAGVGYIIRAAIPTLIVEPVQVRLTFMFRRPAKPPQGYTVAREFKPFPWPVSDERMRYLGHGDVDNLSKTVLDAAQHCRSLADDRLVVELAASKWYCSKDEEPHTVAEFYRAGW